MAHTAFIVRVPEAEQAVSGLRERFDPSARLGVPAHITILYPFMSPDLISERVLAVIAQVLREVAPFAVTLTEVKRFPSVVYLAPEPSAPLVQLTRSLVERFPDYPPFSGEHDAIIPHLTVAHGSAAEVDAAEAELAGVLRSFGPIRSTCSSVALLENSSGMWRQMHAFSLGER